MRAASTSAPIASWVRARLRPVHGTPTSSASAVATTIRLHGPRSAGTSRLGTLAWWDHLDIAMDVCERWHGTTTIAVLEAVEAKGEPVPRWNISSK